MRRRYVGIVIAILIALVVVVVIKPWVPSGESEFNRLKADLRADAAVAFDAVDSYGTAWPQWSTPVEGFFIDVAVIKTGWPDLSPLSAADESCRRGLAAAGEETSVATIQQTWPRADLAAAFDACTRGVEWQAPLR